MHTSQAIKDRSPQINEQHVLGGMSRRRFLYATAMAAGSTVLAACTSSDGNKPKGGTTTKSVSSDKVGSATTPVAPPRHYSEAPSLKGKGLPPVADRLPQNPLVVPHRWVQRGKYGGTLNTCVFGSTGMASAFSNHNFFYGFSPTRWLNDGLDIGPGTADKWASNSDATEWTIYFRKGLKWSDGVEFDVDDVIFWYEDIAKPGHDGQVIPPDLLSANNTPATITRVDQYTMKIAYDAPQPLVPDYLACWVKGGLGNNGPVWIMPKHYLKQFHPKYGTNVPKDWDTPGGLWEQHADWLRNAQCPTLTGFKCKSWDNNNGAVLERNPYYYVVTADGDQLPYLDTWTFDLFQNAQTLKVEVQQGKFGYVQGEFNQIDLSDVSALSQSKSEGNYEILLWDSGNGTGSMFFLNYDYIAKDEKYGKLFRDKRFRQAISYAFDRVTANKVLYFQTGEITTGTMSPKAIEYHTKPDGPSTYRAWRDAAKTHDVKKARSLLAAMGLKDRNGDGYVEFPDGSTLEIDIPYSADIAATEAAKDDQLVANAKDAGLRMRRTPIPPQAFADSWSNGQFMSRTNWAVGDGPNVLVYPQWLAPLEAARWAPLEGRWYSLTGNPKQQQELNVAPIKRQPPRMATEPGSPTDKLITLYNKTKRETDQLKRTQLVWQIFKIHADELFFIGCTANFPRVNIRNKDLNNVPARNNLAQHGYDGPWTVPAPAVYDPECWYWNNPTQHA